MNNRNPSCGWTQKSGSCLADQVADDQLTRIVMVNPDTGEICPFEKGQDANNLEATLVRSGTKQEPSSGRGRSSEFIPFKGHVSTSEMTTLWSSPKRFDVVALFNRLSSSFRTMSTNQRFVVYFCAAVLLASGGGTAIGFAGSNNSAQKVTTELQSNPTTAKKKNPKHLSQLTNPGRQSNRERAPRFGSASGIRLKEAADALIEGRLDEALYLYQQLETAFPNDPSYPLAVHILLKSENGRSR